MRRHRALFVRCALVALVACAPAAEPPAPIAAPAPVPPSPPAVTASRPVPLPTDAPRFALGRAPTDAELAALDTDVAPDGAGLPPGGGTAFDGADVYRLKCASCHGAQGENARFGRLFGRGDPSGYKLGGPPRGAVGATVGNHWPYATTLFDYVRRSMPVNAPGSLSSDEVYAVTAWILWKNGLVNEKTRLDAASLPKVVMPARDRFIEADASTR